MEVGAYAAKTNLPKLLARVARGERITITKHGKAVAELVPTDDSRLQANRKAWDELMKVKQRLRARGMRITKEEIIAWKNEGRR